MVLTDPALRDTLVSVGVLMRQARDPWWIIGSAAAAMYAAKSIPIADVDVLLSTVDAYRILPTIGLQPLPGSGNDLFRSDVFATWHDRPMLVEFMAGFHHNGTDGWHLVQPLTTVTIALRGVPLCLPERSELVSLFKRFGRPKDNERAHLLADTS